MKPMYTPFEARVVLARWALVLSGCLILTVAGNISFSRYLVAEREDDPDTHLNRAETLMATSDLIGAQVSVENAMDRAPLYPRAHKVQGDILFKQEAWQDAEVAYKQCLDLGGDYPGVQNNVLWSLIMQESYDEAVALGETFMASKDYSRLVPKYVAEACVRGERWEEALTYLTLALEANPKEKYVLELLRLTYNRLGARAEEDRVLARINAIDLELEKEQQLTQLPPH